MNPYYVMQEIWKPIPDYEGYEASTQGRIRNSRTGRILKPGLRSGYLHVDLQRKSKYVHILVAQTFIPNPDNLPQVNHRNENKEDDRVENLEWCDAKYNANYGTRNERLKKSNYNLGKSKEVYQYSTTGDFIRTWESTRTVEEYMNICHTSISKCCRGITKTCGGFIWRYAE